MKINLHETTFRGRLGTVTLAQVQITAPPLRQDLAVFVLHTAPTRSGAIDGALHKAIASIQTLTEQERGQLGLPPDDGVAVHVYRAFSRVLQTHGGAWEEERARGHGARTRRLMGLEVQVNALDRLAVLYE